MTINPLEYLCYHDTRNPNAYEEDRREPRRKDCGCDNCFYGKDGLALEIIRLQEKVDELELRVESLESEDTGPR